jgi:hypothetical protein
MSKTIWNAGDPYNYVEIVAQAFAVARPTYTKLFYNIYHFRRTTTINVLVKSHINTAFQANVVAPLLLALNVDYTQSANTIRFFENPIDEATAFTESGVGAVTGNRLPDLNAAVIQLHSGVRGRPYRGSKHYGPIAESSTTGDDLTSGAVTLFDAVGAALVAGFADSDGNAWVPGLKGGVRIGSDAQYLTVPTTTIWTDITSYVLNKTVGSMRRRKTKTIV